MHAAVRPYVTTGVALVGASVIAVAPIAPPPADIQIANPVSNPARLINPAVKLAANVEDAVNERIFNVVASQLQFVDLLVPVLEPILGPQATGLPLLYLGITGPLISGLGAFGTATQAVLDALGTGEQLDQLLNVLGDVPRVILTGLTSGGFGPNLAPLVADEIAAAVSAELGTMVSPDQIVTAQAGGLYSTFELHAIINPTPPPEIVFNTMLDGLFTTLRSLAAQLLDLAGLNPQPKPSSTMTSKTEGSSTTMSVNSFTPTNGPLVNVDLNETISTPNQAAEQAEDALDTATQGAANATEGLAKASDEAAAQAQQRLDTAAAGAANATNGLAQATEVAPAQAHEGLGTARGAATTERPNGATDLTDGNRVKPGQAPTTNPTEHATDVLEDVQERAATKTEHAYSGLANAQGHVQKAGPSASGASAGATGKAAEN